MKISRYNKFIELYGKEYYVYNSYTNNLLKVDYNIFIALKNGDINFMKENIDLINILKNESIVVDDDEDIYNKIKLQRLISRFNNSYLSLTIAPTLNCNFNCKYCYEHSHITKSNTNKKLFIDSIISFIINNNVTNLRITWYGGEPLIKFDYIKEITIRIKELAINYNAIMISNGYLLNEKKSRELESLNIKQIQITIDGLESTHNERRPHKKNKDSFKKIINNINNLLIINKDIKISLRINVDKYNEDEYHKLYFFLIDMFNNNNNIYIHPGFISNINSCYNNEKCLDYKEVNNFKINQFEKYGVPFKLYPESDFGECVARHINSFVIDPNLNIYKCWNDIGIIEKSIGTIDNFKLSNNLNIKYLTSNDPLEDYKCKICSFFPICNGGCPYDRIFHTKNKSELCKYKDEFFSNLIKTHIETTKER